MSRWAALTSRVRVSIRSRPPLPFIPTFIGLRAFDLVSSRVWWEAATNIGVQQSFWLVRLSSCWVTLRRAVLWTGRFQTGVPWHWRSFWPEGAVPPRLYPLQRGWVNCLAPEVPLFRGMPTGPKAFLGLPDASGLWPCDWIHLKMAFCHTCTLGEAYNKYQFTNQRDTITCDTICVVDSRESSGVVTTPVDSQLTTVQPGSLVSCFCYLNICFLPTFFVFPVFFFCHNHNTFTATAAKIYNILVSQLYLTWS